MIAKRRKKLQHLANHLPPPEIYGPPQGDILLVGWGSTRGAIREAIDKSRATGAKISALHLRHLNPLPNGLENTFAQFKHIIVVEMNDEGLYGHGQLAMLLRARYCDPKIRSLTKTDGVTFKVKEILDRVKTDIATGMNRY